jgi:DNA polymerase-3 subunit gamma/tau
MSYQVLARKWRPQNFSSLVGQEPIVTALRNALQEGRIAQAYLFSGIRGVGKTTAARVLAKALNCQRGPAADPCNECIACVEITRGSDLDVIEVDAATYSKVEQVRELTESLKYGPARDRYKVVVLDEIHRLSRQAFDALLKIVEEPPPHLVFIFATTEIDAVPATILSRCQEFNFRRVPAQRVADLLREICTAEKITASDAALRLVARAGEGSVRDAVALLDQLATFGSGEIGDEEAVRLLGGLDLALFHRLLAAILAGDREGVGVAVARIEDEGWDARHVFGQFLAFCRDALHLALAAGGAGEASRAGQTDLPAEEALALAALAREAGYENLLRLMNQLLASEETVRRSEAGALAVEVAWLRAAELPKLTRVEQLLGGSSPGAGFSTGGGRAAAPAAQGPQRGVRSPAPPAAAARHAPVEVAAAPVAAASSTAAASPPAAATASTPTASAPSTAAASSPSVPAAAAGSTPAASPRSLRMAPAAPTPLAPALAEAAASGEPAASPVEPAGPPLAAAPPARSASSPATTSGAPAASPAKSASAPVAVAGDGDEVKAAFLQEISKRKQPLAAHLEEAQALDFAGGRLRILLRPGDVYLAPRLRQPANRQLIDEAVTAVWGAGATWDFSEAAADGAPPSAAGSRAARTGSASATAGGAAAGAAGAASTAGGAQSVVENSTVQTILDIFGGRVEEVEEHGSLREE